MNSPERQKVYYFVEEVLYNGRPISYLQTVDRKGN